MFSFVWHEHDKVLSVTDESNEGIRCHMTSGLIYESNIRIITGTCCSCSNPAVLCASHYNANALKFCGGINAICAPLNIQNLIATCRGKMIHRISAEDLILQRSASQLDDSCSIASSFTLQDRVEAIQQSSEEFHEMVG